MNDSIHKSPRIYTPHDLSIGAEITLEGPSHHYLKNVMRKEEGDILRLFNPKGGEFKAVIAKLHKKYLVVNLKEQLRPPYTKDVQHPRITLAFSPLPKDRLDMLVEKAVELGAHNLQPLIFDHTSVRRIKEERIESQIIEAAEQCERMDIPTLAPIMQSDHFLRENKMPFFCALERGNALPFSSALQNQDVKQAQMPAPSLTYIIGAEGGFSDRERDALVQNNLCIPVSLGANILRAETAAFYGLSLINAHLAARVTSGTD